jgi:hypothetical protein
LLFLDSLRSKEIYDENLPMKFLNNLLDKSKKIGIEITLDLPREQLWL